MVICGVHMTTRGQSLLVEQATELKKVATASGGGNFTEQLRPGNESNFHYGDKCHTARINWKKGAYFTSFKILLQMLFSTASVFLQENHLQL